MQNPYQNLAGGRWMRVNFHTHAGTGYKTCGQNPIGPVAAIYREAGYDALCISNHDHFTDASEIGDGDFLMIPGVEYSQDEHMLTIGVHASYHANDHQTAINLTREGGGFTILCHPNWPEKDFWPPEKMDRLTGFAGIEVMNTVIYRLSGSGRATDVWDRLLTAGRLKFGFGNDDFHMMTDAGRSFNLIYCRELTYDAIKQAIFEGAFCASTGLWLDYLRLEDGVLRVRAKYPRPTYIDTFTYRFITAHGRIAAEQTAQVGEYALQGEPYVRVEAVGENGALLFCQPVYDPEQFHRD